MFSVKELIDSGSCYSAVPPKYVFQSKPADSEVSHVETIPTIDFSLLTSGSTQQRCEVIRSIGDACREWGFFQVINHGVPRRLREETFKKSIGFFKQSEEELRKYAGKNLFDPIRWGTSFNVAVDKTLFWRDYLKIHAHPNFNAPHHPPGFSEVLQEYCKRSREVANELLKAISKSIGLEENYINKTMEVESATAHQLLVINMYPPCPEPDVAMGLPPHSDHGLLTILMQNDDLPGLQVHHNGKWVAVTPPPDSFVVNIGDQMEILSNGKYKSVLHRAVVNEKATRVSIATAHGPPLDKVVAPAAELNERGVYGGMKYKEYMELQQSHTLDGKSCLSYLRV